MSAFAENSASSFGLARAESRDGGPIDEARYAGLGEKSGIGLLIEIRLEAQSWTTRF